MPAPDPTDQRLRGRTRQDIEHDLLAQAVTLRSAVPTEMVRTWRRSWFTVARHVALLDALQEDVREPGALARRLGMSAHSFGAWLTNTFTTVIDDDVALLREWAAPACASCGRAAVEAYGDLCMSCARAQAAEVEALRRPF